MIIHKEQFKLLPWLNGKGSTLEMLIYPSSDFKELSFDYRVSSATIIESGEFSLFPNYRRWLLMLDNTQVQLHIETQVHHLTPSTEAFAFDGDMKVFSKVIKEGRDFNLIVHKKYNHVHVRRIRDSQSGQQGDTILYNCGDIVLITIGGKQYQLKKGNLIQFSGYMELSKTEGVADLICCTIA